MNNSSLTALRRKAEWDMIMTEPLGLVDLMNEKNITAREQILDEYIKDHPSLLNPTIK